MEAIDFSKYSPKNQKNDTGSPENQIVVLMSDKCQIHIGNMSGNIFGIILTP